MLGKWNIENRNPWQGWAGFTFIELMIVVAVIGILSSLFVTQYPATQRRARDAERRSDIKQYQTAMESYANRNNGNYPVAGPDVILPAGLCATLGVPDCPNDPQNSYYVASTSTEYVLWATLEQPQTPTTYFIVCSTGQAGEDPALPFGANCPL